MVHVFYFLKNLGILFLLLFFLFSLVFFPFYLDWISRPFYISCRKHGCLEYGTPSPQRASPSRAVKLYQGMGILYIVFFNMFFVIFL